MGKKYCVDENSLTAIIDAPREIIGIVDYQFPLSEFPDMIYNAVGYAAGQAAESAYQGGLEEGYWNGYGEGYGAAMSEVEDTIQGAWNEGWGMGYEVGYGEGTENGILIAGYIAKQEFWDKFQDYGNRTDYQYAFAGLSWTEENLTPYYDISETTLSNAYMMFAKGTVANLKDIFPQLVVNGSQYMFLSNTAVTDLGTIVLYDEAYGTFSGCSKLKNIDNLVIAWSNSGAKDYSSTFNGCSSLENVTVSGAGYGIRGGMALGAAKKLSRYSIASFIDALSPEVSDKTISFSLEAVNKGFETSSGAKDGSTSADWLALVNTKPNWNISLV